MKQDEVNSESTDSKREASLGLGIWVVFVLIFLAWGMYWKWVTPLVTENKFDPLNVLFSGLAFWGVIYAILLQKSELALQRRELELGRVNTNHAICAILCAWKSPTHSTA